MEQAHYGGAARKSKSPKFQRRRNTGPYSSDSGSQVYDSVPYCDSSTSNDPACRQNPPPSTFQPSPGVPRPVASSSRRSRAPKPPASCTRHGFITCDQRPPCGVQQVTRRVREAPCPRPCDLERRRRRHYGRLGGLSFTRRRGTPSSEERQRRKRFHRTPSRKHRKRFGDPYRPLKHRRRPSCERDRCHRRSRSKCRMSRKCSRRSREGCRLRKDACQSYDIYHPPREALYQPPREALYRPPQEVVYQPPKKVRRPRKKVNTPPREVYTPPQEVYTPPQEVNRPPKKVRSKHRKVSTPPKEEYPHTHETYVHQPEKSSSMEGFKRWASSRKRSKSRVKRPRETYASSRRIPEQPNTYEREPTEVKLRPIRKIRPDLCEQPVQPPCTEPEEEIKYQSCPKICAANVMKDWMPDGLKQATTKISFRDPETKLETIVIISNEDDMTNQGGSGTRGASKSDSCGCSLAGDKDGILKITKPNVEGESVTIVPGVYTAQLLNQYLPNNFKQNLFSLNDQTENLFEIKNNLNNICPVSKLIVPERDQHFYLSPDPDISTAITRRNFNPFPFIFFDESEKSELKINDLSKEPIKNCFTYNNNANELDKGRNFEEFELEKFTEAEPAKRTGNHETKYGTTELLKKQMSIKTLSTVSSRCFSDDYIKYLTKQFHKKYQEALERGLLIKKCGYEKPLDNDKKKYTNAAGNESTSDQLLKYSRKGSYIRKSRKALDYKIKNYTNPTAIDLSRDQLLQYSRRGSLMRRKSRHKKVYNIRRKDDGNTTLNESSYDQLSKYSRRGPLLTKSGYEESLYNKKKYYDYEAMNECDQLLKFARRNRPKTEWSRLSGLLSSHFFLNASEKAENAWKTLPTRSVYYCSYESSFQSDISKQIRKSNAKSFWKKLVHYLMTHKELTSKPVNVSTI